MEIKSVRILYNELNTLNVVCHGIHIRSNKEKPPGDITNRLIRVAIYDSFCTEQTGCLVCRACFSNKNGDENRILEERPLELLWNKSTLYTSS